MIEDGSKGGFIIGAIGGYLNLAVMGGIMIKVVIMALESLEAEAPDYATYFIHIGIMFYAGILGVWILSASYKMKYSDTLYKGAVVCLVLGILSLNIFAIFGGIFGLAEFKGIAVEMAREKLAKVPDDLKMNPSF